MTYVKMTTELARSIKESPAGVMPRELSNYDTPAGKGAVTGLPDSSLKKPEDITVRIARATGAMR